VINLLVVETQLRLPYCMDWMKGLRWGVLRPDMIPYVDKEAADAVVSARLFLPSSLFSPWARSTHCRALGR
jgi:hypothetical protein